MSEGAVRFTCCDHRMRYLNGICGEPGRHVDPALLRKPLVIRQVLADRHVDASRDSSLCSKK